MVCHQSEDITRVRPSLVCQTKGLRVIAMDEILSFSATHQARLLRQRSISSVELVQAHLERIATVNPRIHAVVEVLAAQALAAARTADEALAREADAGPLCGVPFSIKDSIELAGTVSTAGTLGRRNAPPSTEDATLVARLRQAGAIPIARTNLPDLLFAFESDNLLFGATCNPYDAARTAGGSSGGEAALIASCGSPMGLGSDAAGSVRLPAAFCGIAAIKPTSGRLPRTGHFPPAGGWIEALWQIGPMARHVEDLYTVMPLLAGGDGRDTSVVDMPYRDPAWVELQRLRIAFHTDNGFAPADAEVAGVVRAAARALAGEVATLEEDRPACLAQAYDLEMKLLGVDGGDGLRGVPARLGFDAGTPAAHRVAGQAGSVSHQRRGLCRLLGGVGCLPRGNGRISAPLRRHGVSGLYARRAAAWRIHAAGELPRLQPHHGVQRGRMAGRRGALRHLGNRLADRRADCCGAVARRYRVGGGRAVGARVRRLEGGGENRGAGRPVVAGKGLNLESSAVCHKATCRS